MNPWIIAGIIAGIVLLYFGIGIGLAAFVYRRFDGHNGVYYEMHPMEAGLGAVLWPVFALIGLFVLVGLFVRFVSRGRA